MHQGARPAGEPGLPGRQGMPGLEVPQLERDDLADSPSGRQEPPAGFGGAHVQPEDQLQGPAQGRRGRCVSLREPQRERVEQDIDRPWRVGTRRCGARGLGGFPHRAGGVPLAGLHRGFPERLQVRLARQAGVERLEPAGCVEQQPRRVAAAALVEGDLPAQVLRLGNPQRLPRPGTLILGRHQQPQRGVQRAGVPHRVGRREQPLRPADGFAGQQRRLLQERGRRRHAAPGLRPAGRTLQLRRDVLVGTRRRLSPVPGPPVGVGLRIGDLGQGPVYLPPVVERGRPVGHRAHQRMAQPDLGAELEQPGLGRRRYRPGADPEALGGLPHQHRIANRVGGGELHQAPGLGRKSVELPLEAFLEPPRKRDRAGQAESARQFGRCQAPRQLQQGQRIAARLGHDLVAHPRVQRPGECRVQQGSRITVPQALHDQLRQPAQLLAGLADGEDQAHRFRLQPTGHERENLRGSPVEPLLVIHQAHQRPLPGHVGQQAEHGQADQEPVRRGAGADAERRAERLTLRARQPLQVPEHRRAQLVHRREGELHLGLDTGRPHHPASQRVSGQVIQQRRLARPRLTAQHQRPALTHANRLDQPVEHAALTASPL